MSATELRPFAYTGGDGRIDGFWGLATKPTHHRFTVGGRRLWTWCAQDSMFLPELLGETARIESMDPETGDPVRLSVSPTTVEATEPEEIIFSMVEPSTADLTSAARIIATACRHIVFFAGRASGERWVAAHPNTTLLFSRGGQRAGQRQNARLFGKELERLRAESTNGGVP